MGSKPRILLKLFWFYLVGSFHACILLFDFIWKFYENTKERGSVIYVDESGIFKLFLLYGDLTI